MSSLPAWRKLIRYVSVDGAIKYGEPKADDIADLDDLCSKGKLFVTILEGKDPLSAVPTSKTDQVKRLLGPLEPKDVPIIRCIGLNYKSHILETGRSLPERPTTFTKPPLAVADHLEDIPIPKIAQSQCDYEGEFVIVIGKDAKNVSQDQALDYVAAYTCGNDISARDWQREPSKAGPVPQWTFSKSFDKYAPLGPCLVSRKVLGEADDLEIQTFVNDEERQHSNTSDLCFGVRALVSFCSQGQTLQRGSLIMTGTPGGVGLFMKPARFLQNGDVVSVKISSIGRLSNKMSYE